MTPTEKQAIEGTFQEAMLKSEGDGDTQHILTCLKHSLLEKLEAMPKPEKTAHRIRFTFCGATENKETLVDVAIPGDPSKEEIIRDILDMHNLLEATEANGYSRYGSEGRDADTLLWYLMKEKGWEYAPTKEDISVTIP